MTLKYKYFFLLALFVVIYLIVINIPAIAEYELCMLYATIPFGFWMLVKISSSGNKT